MAERDALLSPPLRVPEPFKTALKAVSLRYGESLHYLVSRITAGVGPEYLRVAPLGLSEPYFASPSLI